MTNIKEEKGALRAIYQKRRESMPSEHRARRDAAICQLLEKSASFRHAATLLAYAPKGAEIDVTPLLETALRTGKRVALPRSLSGGVMHFHYISSLSELARGAFGIMEPPKENERYTPAPAALCLVPGVVFDRAGYRIGYGGGYYDRYLRDFDGTVIGVVYRDFILPSLPHGRYDLAVTALATDKGILPI